MRVGAVRPEQASAAPLVERFAAEADVAGVADCHFKSNRFLRRAELAETVGREGDNAIALAATARLAVGFACARISSRPSSRA